MASIVAAYVVLRHTALGRALYAVGGSEESARLLGIDVERTRLVAYMASGLLAGLAGALHVLRRLHQHELELVGRDGMAGPLVQQLQQRGAWSTTSTPPRPATTT